jgi:hypothetical protein
MVYEVEVTDEWLAWFDELPPRAQVEVAAVIGLLEEKGPHLLFPWGMYSSYQRSLPVFSPPSKRIAMRRGSNA